jgi:DNA modification methylase
VTDPVRIGDATLYLGDVLAVLAELPDESVHCVVTSPPYWGLRDYGIPPSVWDGEPECAHEWGEARRSARLLPVPIIQGTHSPVPMESKPLLPPQR